MTKKQQLSHGMARKWERHFTGKWRLLGQASVVSGMVILVLGTVLWPQVKYCCVCIPKCPPASCLAP